MAKVGMATTCESSDDADHMTMLVDSGASGHYFDNELQPSLRDKLLNYKELEKSHNIVTAGRNVLLGTATGTASGVIIDEKGHRHQVDLPGLVVPGLGHHQFSASQAAKNGLATSIDSRPRLEQGQHVVPLQQLNKNQDLFSFDLGFILAPATSRPSRNTTALTALQAPADLWHRRMGHVNPQSLWILRDASDNGIYFSDSVSPCDVCAFGKSKQERHPKTTAHNTARPFPLVYTDPLGPVSPPALGGFRYVSMFTDQHSKWKEVFLIREKVDAINTLKQCVQTVVVPRGLRIERLRTDRGGEYTAGYFEKYCLVTGIIHVFAATNAPQQNGVPDRDGRTIAKIARCLLKDARFPKELWGEMSFTATYLANRMPHSALQTQAPFTVLFGVHAKLDHLRAIGVRAFVHVERHTTKLEDKAWDGRLCDYSMNSKAYRIYNPETRRITESRNVIFIETPASTLIDPYTSNNSDANGSQEGNSSSGNTTDISITNHEDPHTSTISESSTPGIGAIPGTPHTADDENTPSPVTTKTGVQRIGREQGGATRMRTQVTVAVAPISQEGLNAHQHRGLRNLGLLAT